ncbi:MAG: AAA family ATPase, partial [Sphingobacterium sp.]
VKYRYHPKVFLLPPWKEIYVNDQERKQTWQQAVETYNWIKQTYNQFNYHIVELPLTTVENRIAFIIENLTH